MPDLPLIPVRPGNNGELRDAEGRLIGHIYGHRQSGRLDFIVKALNRDALFDEMVEALAFYADPRRYDGPNQKNPGDDKHSAGPYLQNVTRDNGDLARAVLSKVREASK